MNLSFLQNKKQEYAGGKLKSGIVNDKSKTKIKTKAQSIQFMIIRRERLIFLITDFVIIILLSFTSDLKS